MLEITEGAVLSVPLHGTTCVLAHVLTIDRMPLGDIFHVAILDALIEAGPPGESDRGDFLPRAHVLAGEEEAPQAIEHLAVEEKALLESEPMIVAWRDVEESELLGYESWLEHLQRAPQYTLPQLSERYGKGYGFGRSPKVQPLISEGVQPEFVWEAGMPWVGHGIIWRIPLGEEFKEKREWCNLDLPLPQQFIAELYVAGQHVEVVDRSEEIRMLIEQLAEGDFSATEELALHGDAVITPLQERLLNNPAPQFLEDAMTVLAAIDTESAHRVLGATFSVLVGKNTLLARAAERGYLFVLNPSSAASEPLRACRHLLDLITDPQLAGDVAAARAALAEADRELEAEEESEEDL